MIVTPRLACILAPNLSIQVERQRRGNRAQFIIPHPLNGETVFAASSSLLLAGVEAGMPLHQAKQIAPYAIIVEPDEAEYHERHETVREAIKTFSTAIETVRLGEFLIDVRGLGRVHDGEAELAKALTISVSNASRLAIRVGIATGKFVAQQAARLTFNNTSQVVEAGWEQDFVSPIPIHVLPEVPAEMRRRLQLLDIHTLGGLAALNKPAVLRQFGKDASLLYELARGRDRRVLQIDLPPLRIVRSMALDEPVQGGYILLNVVNHLSRRLSRVLATRGYHAEALKLTVDVGRSSPIRLEHGQALKPPTADEGRISRLAMQLLGRLGKLEPVSRTSLCAYPLRSWHLDAHQLALIQADVPERTARLEDVIQLILHRFGQAAVKFASLLGPPLPVKVHVRIGANGLPVVLSSFGRTYGVMGVHEHWREKQGWWTKPARRDYYRVMLSDESLRNIFHDQNGEWYLDRAWPIL